MVNSMLLVVVVLSGCSVSAASEPKAVDRKRPSSQQSSRDQQPRPTYPAKSNTSEKATARINFPEYLPGSQIVIGKELVDRVNMLESRNRQIQFLLSLLPPVDQPDRQLTEQQIYAIRLLSLTDSDVAVDALIARIDFANMRDGAPCVRALERLGERAVAPIVTALQGESARHHVNEYSAVLILIKNEKFPEFIQQLQKRADVKLSPDVVNELLLNYKNYMAKYH